ncbi:MAG: hypothetical protein KDN20_21690 [Verrucomicrobiae bacterium]|nr:hypothetical protein [Verrucomicrobiae bacterium]
MEDTAQERNHGPQPLDAIMTELGIGNHELVEASTEQLTHKQVQKGRKGRQLTANLRTKIAHAMNAVLAVRGEESRFKSGDLFDYGK